MNILLVVTNADVGGAQKRIIDLATSYQRAGHSVTVASGPFGEYLPAELEDKGIPYQRFQYLSRANPFKMVVSIFEQWNFIRKADFDVVHLNSSSGLAGGLAAKLQLKRPKTVFTFRGLSMLAPGYKTNKLFKLVYEYSYKAFLPFIDVGVFQCEANQEMAHKIGLHTKKEAVIRDGINTEDVDFLPREEARQQLEEMVGGDLSDKKIVGTIGRLVYAKNYGFLIQQIRKLGKYRQDVVAIIIGDGPEREKLEAEISRLGLEDRIFLAGEQENAAQFLRVFDVFTLPSRYEGLSMTLTEALHAGVPMLVSDVGCSGSVVSDERMVFAPGNALDFVSKLRGLLDIENTEQLAEEVKRKGEKLTLERSAEQYLAVYERDSDNKETDEDIAVVADPEDKAEPEREQGKESAQKEESTGPRTVLHLITGLESGGGAETFLSRILPQLKKDESVRHVICSLRPAGVIGDELSAAGVEVRSLNQRFKFDPRIIARYRRMLAELKPDLQINYLFHADIFGRFFGKRFGVRKVAAFVRNKHQGWAYALVEKLTIGSVDCLLTNSQAVMDYYAANYELPDCTAVIPNGVPLPEDIEKTSHEEDDGFVVTAVARLHPQKRLETLVEAAAILKEDIPELEVLFVGEGAEKLRLEKLAERLGVKRQIYFLGKIDNVSDILAASDVFVLPSEKEGMSNALLEAMAMGLPCVVSDIPENTELVESGENGFAFRLGDAQDLADKLLKLYSDSQLREDYGQQARQRIKEKYSIEAARKRLQEFIETQI